MCTGLGRYQGVRVGWEGVCVRIFLENLLFQMSLESRLGMNSNGKEKALHSKRGEYKLTVSFASRNGIDDRWVSL